MVVVLSIPNAIFDPEVREITFTIGILGIWRYGWWFTHALRAWIYSDFVYPKMQKRGREIWDSGWRPRQLHFMMTTYREHREITEMVVRSVIGEIVQSGVPGTIWLGSSDRYDEDIVSEVLHREAAVATAGGRAGDAGLEALAWPV